MKISTPYSKRRARIEIVPLIDIIFFLLATFVMVSMSMIKNEGVPVHLPTATTAVPQERQDSVNISVTKDGEFYAGKEKVTIDELKVQLSVLKAKQSDPRIFIYGDENTSFSNMMQVLDAVRSLGITKVAMQTKAETKKEETA